MKVTNLVISIISAVVMMTADFFIFAITFLSSMVGAFVYNFSTADHENIHESFGMFGLSLLIGIIAIAALILPIVGFVKSTKPDAKASTYGAIYGILCGATLIANICTIPIVIWINSFVGDASFYYAWPVVGFVLLIPMVIFTIISTVGMKKRAA